MLVGELWVVDVTGKVGSAAAPLVHAATLSATTANRGERCRQYQLLDRIELTLPISRGTSPLISFQR